MTVLLAVLATVVPMIVLALLVPAALGTLCNPAAVGDRALDVRDSVLRRGGSDEPEVRPFEEVISEIRRLGRRYHHHQVSHIKEESLRQAYDAALVAGCSALGIENLLTVIPPGPELDRERLRVERLLHKWGVDLSDLDVDDAA